MNTGRWTFLLYCPAGVDEVVADYFVCRMRGAGVIGQRNFESIFQQFTDFGEINRSYSGFDEIYDHFALVMTRPLGHGAGILVFKPKSLNLIEIDIMALQGELRGTGLGRYMYGFFESACADGTALYIERVTDQGRKFFTRCGYQRDVDFFKILAEENRVDVPDQDL